MIDFCNVFPEGTDECKVCVFRAMASSGSKEQIVEGIKQSRIKVQNQITTIYHITDEI